VISSSGYKIPPQKPSYTKIYTKHMSLMLLYTSKLHSHLSRNLVHSAVMHAASHWCLYRPSWAMRHRCPAFLQPAMTGFNWIVKFLSADWQAQVRWWTEINWIWRRVPGLLHTKTSTDTQLNSQWTKYGYVNAMCWLHQRRRQDWSWNSNVAMCTDMVVILWFTSTSELTTATGLKCQN